MGKSALFCVLFLLLLSNCKINTEEVIDVEGKDIVDDHFIDECLTPKDREFILKEIVQSSDFQLYLHPELLERLPVRVAKNRPFNNEISVESNGYRVQFVDLNRAFTDDIHRIEIIELDCEKGLLTYAVKYPIEGVFIDGTIIKKKDVWITENVNSYKE
jgi:hypothetical protein